MKDAGEFVSGRTKILLKLAEPHVGDKLENIEYGAYTILKLICVHHYAGFFTKIAKGKSATFWGYDGAVYIDLFAGPGIVKIRETGDSVAGSPVAVASTNPQFDYSFFVELNEGRRNALQARMKEILPERNYEIIPKDCNLSIPYIVEQINQRFKKPIVFVFVDPEGMEIKWETIKTLSSAFKSADFMINVNSGAARVAGRMNSNDLRYHDRPIFEDFFQNAKAEEVLVRLNSGMTVENIYENAVKEILGRPVGKTIPIRDRGDVTVYNILAYTRMNPSGSPWSKAFTILEQELLHMDGQNVKSILDVLQDRSGTISSYFNS